jgi:hypothetical protein
LTRRQIALLLLITIGAVLVHGYHPAAEDGEFYLPGVIKDINPSLYPFNSHFFLSHAHMTLFDELISTSVRVSHLPLDYMLFFWHFACVFGLLLACWRIARICFRDERAPWGSVALVASLLTIPVAGTALYVLDQYLNPRDISTAALLLLLAEAMKRRFGFALTGMLLVATIHPLMAGFGIALVAVLFLEYKRSSPAHLASRKIFNEVGATAALLVFLPFFPPVSNVYRQLLATNDSYFLITRWEWFAWPGILFPPLIFWCIARYGKRCGLPNMVVLSRALIVFELIFFAVGVLVCIPRLTPFALLQPMRSLHLVFILLFVLLGGILAESVLKSHVWRWMAFVAPLCFIMFFVQRQLFPATEHLELPGRQPHNCWVQAFSWARENTPTDAIFALDPRYMGLRGEDQHGFRAIAQRSAVAGIHDNGAVIMFPALAQEWSQQVEAQRGWKNFQPSDYQRLRRQYNVSWVVLQRPPVPGLDCPYQNDEVAVCRVP